MNMQSSQLLSSDSTLQVDADSDRKRTLAILRAKYLDRLQKQKDHILKQNDENTKRKIILDAKERTRDMEEDSERKEYLLERRKRLYGLSFPPRRVPIPLEYLHPGNPHFHPQYRREAVTKQSSKSSTSRSKPSNPSRSYLHPRNAASVDSLSNQTSFSNPTLQKGSTSTISRVQQHSSTNYHEHLPYKSLQNDSLFRGRVYREQALDVHSLRSYLHQPTLPPSKKYHPTFHASRRLSQVPSRISSTREGGTRPKRSGAHGTIRKLRSFQSRKKSAGFDVDRGGDATWSVFGGEREFEDFKKRYAEVWKVDEPESMPNLDDLATPIQSHLALKQQMYTAAHRNRQRTLTFAQAGGMTSLVGTRDHPKAHGLQNFARDFLHFRTDLPHEYGDQIEEEGSEDSDGNPEPQDVATHATIRWGALRTGLAVGLIPKDQPKALAKEDSIRSRPTSAVVFGDRSGYSSEPDDDVEPGAIAKLQRASRPTSSSSTKATSRPNSGAQRAIELAKEKIATGRRGPVLKPIPKAPKPATTDDTLRKSPSKKSRPSSAVEGNKPTQLSTPLISTPQLFAPQLFAPKPSMFTLIQQLRSMKSEKSDEDQAARIHEEEDSSTTEDPSLHTLPTPQPTNTTRPSPQPLPLPSQTRQKWEPISLRAVSELRSTIHPSHLSAHSIRPSLSSSQHPARSDSAVDMHDHGSLVRSLGLGFGMASCEGGETKGKVVLPNLNRFWRAGEVGL
ncbi:hypothetical protein HK097_010156 [Rhizophlyctis rosea]|uniref:Uncharacterized protein n=1 Tax=Rhizophlyctis rosea TaxID=64517 RepID=A0AAD5SKJ3_9FUNG|nr:hypothetical protein HK097_010156 [Rhizophlyctis rosea]